MIGYHTDYVDERAPEEKIADRLPWWGHLPRGVWIGTAGVSLKVQRSAVRPPPPPKSSYVDDYIYGMHTWEEGVDGWK